LLLHDHRTRRLHAALTALAFVFASLLGVLHEATTTHVRCAEHGELIDVPAGIAAAPTRDTTATEKASTSSDQDDHCLLASAVRESRIVPRSPVIVPQVAAIGDLVVAGPLVIQPPAKNLYRTAPKTSPPV